MFTVKHILSAEDSRSAGSGPMPNIENLYQGERITFHPVEGNLGALEIRTGDTVIACLWGGMAYVMNEHGKTVSRFDLPDMPRKFGRVDLAPEGFRTEFAPNGHAIAFVADTDEKVDA